MKQTEKPERILRLFFMRIPVLERDRGFVGMIYKNWKLSGHFSNSLPIIFRKNTKKMKKNKITIETLYYLRYNLIGHIGVPKLFIITEM